MRILARLTTDDDRRRAGARACRYTPSHAMGREMMVITVVLHGAMRHSAYANSAISRIVRFAGTPYHRAYRAVARADQAGD